tara:strand:+ start:7196 stop:7726 length:531 start_codon:yes stop_codon:yes gene_type:complete
MKTIVALIDEAVALIPWLVVGWIIVNVFFGLTLSAQELTKEQDIIAQTILGEARGEGKEGMYAVACVIKQRMNLKRFPNTATGVCLQKAQFEYWTVDDKVKWDDQNRDAVRRLLKYNTESARYAKALAIHINKVNLNYIEKADHYCRVNVHNYWTKGQKPVRIIGKHKFFKICGFR